MDKDIQVIAEKCSQFQELDTSELPLLRPYVENFLDKDWLDTRLQEYKAWAKNNSEPFLQHNFLHRPTGFNMLVSAVWAAHYWEREHQSDASFQPRMGAIRLMNIASSLAVLELHAKQWLNSTSREYLRQRLQSTGELWGGIHELNTFAFFIRQGAVVEPHFLKKQVHEKSQSTGVGMLSRFNVKTCALALAEVFLRKCLLTLPATLL